MESNENYKIGKGRNKPAPLPPGGYVARITDSRTLISKGGNPYIDITVEIIEGDYAGWFQRDYDARCGGKYKAAHRGHYRVFVPRNDGSKGEDERVKMTGLVAKRILGNDEAETWDQTRPEAFIGHEVGIVVREVEFNGHPYVEIGKLLTPKAARESNFTPMEKRIVHKDENQLQNQEQNNVIPSGFTEADNDDLPF